MKMPENMTCWPPFSRQRNKVSKLAFAMAYLRGDIMAVRLQNSNRRNDVRHYRPVHRDLPDSAGQVAISLI